jgi:hypothetical protein
LVPSFSFLTCVCTPQVELEKLNPDEPLEEKSETSEEDSDAVNEEAQKAADEKARQEAARWNAAAVAGEFTSGSFPIGLCYKVRMAC